MNVEDTIPLEVRGNTLRYVGRGGLKLGKGYGSVSHRS